MLTSADAGEHERVPVVVGMPLWIFAETLNPQMSEWKQTVLFIEQVQQQNKGPTGELGCWQRNLYLAISRLDKSGLGALLCKRGRIVVCEGERMEGKEDCGQQVEHWQWFVRARSYQLAGGDY